MTNETKQTAVDSIIEFCQKQMDNDSSIHKGVYLSIIKFSQEQAKEMEKEQAKHWFKLGMHLVEGALLKPSDKFDEHYEETYGGNK